MPERLVTDQAHAAGFRLARRYLLERARLRRRIAPRDRLVADEFASRVYRPQGWISAVLLADGRIAGTWRHEKRRTAVDVEAQPFGRFRRRRELREEAERLGAFLRLPVRLRVASAGSA